jgi:hypothetical protein
MDTEATDATNGSKKPVDKRTIKRKRPKSECALDNLDHVRINFPNHKKRSWTCNNCEPVRAIQTYDWVAKCVHCKHCRRCDTLIRSSHHAVCPFCATGCFDYRRGKDRCQSCKVNKGMPLDNLAFAACAAVPLGNAAGNDTTSVATTANTGSAATFGLPMLPQLLSSSGHRAKLSGQAAGTSATPTFNGAAASAGRTTPSESSTTPIPTGAPLT